ncbi:hypothetical protein [Devosia sp. 2618]|uniref:hypothetical protein n=1 Tax=Devosia sp. 2618 TaxID=3156454 RepID=UPI00339A1B6C
MVRDCTGRTVTKTAETEAAYVRRFLALQQAACLDSFGTGMEQVIDWFTSQHARWAESTVRQYRAAAICLHAVVMSA